MSAKLCSNIGRIVKGMILSAWIIVLILLAGLAATGQVSSWLQGNLQRLHYNAPTQEKQIEIEGAMLLPAGAIHWWETGKIKAFPYEFLSAYLQGKNHPPPIETILDALMYDPSWSERDIAPPEGIIGAEALKWTQLQYFALFDKVANQLHPLCSKKNAEIKSFRIAFIIPQAFRREGEVRSKEIELPQHVLTWMEEEIAMQQAAARRNSLVDTFFLLIVLGAFGSLVFLTEDYIKAQDTPLAGYIFRPILGMFLALATFIVDVMLHATISNSDIMQIKHESLYIIAFAGGLLSEKVYTALSNRLQPVVDKFGKDELPEPPTPLNVPKPVENATHTKSDP
ncbi:MAG: hypothetical protein AB9866_06065 [Syntrophobacteraceae bacterium]